MLAEALHLPFRTWANYKSGIIIPSLVMLRFILLTGACPRWSLTEILLDIARPGGDHVRIHPIPLGDPARDPGVAVPRGRDVGLLPGMRGRLELHQPDARNPSGSSARATSGALVSARLAAPDRRGLMLILPSHDELLTAFKSQSE